MFCQIIPYMYVYGDDSNSPFYDISTKLCEQTEGKKKKNSYETIQSKDLSKIVFALAGFL